MSEVKRYDYDSKERHFYEDSYEVHGVYPNEDGKYVRFEDYEKLTAENQALREAATGLIGNALDMGACYEISVEAYESLKKLLEGSK